MKIEKDKENRSTTQAIYEPSFLKKNELKNCIIEEGLLSIHLADADLGTAI
ncbi:unnamed protein product, partial [Adineta steineri]